MTKFLLRIQHYRASGLPRTFFRPIATNRSESRLLGSSSLQHKDDRKISTVDTADVQHHVNIIKEWWDPNGIMQPLHAMNLVRVPFVRDGLVQCQLHERTSTPLKDLKILDVGCGGGIFAEALARIGAKVTGIDAGKELVEAAQAHSLKDPKLEGNRPNYVFTSIEDHAETHANTYDAVVASEIIEHVNNKELFVKACVDTLKPDGRIFFTTPNRTRAAQVAGIWMAEYVFNLLPRGTHQYEKFITPTELTFLLEKNNCHVEVIHGLFFSILTRKWSVISSPFLSYALQAVKLK